MAWLPDGGKWRYIYSFLQNTRTWRTDRQTDTTWRHRPRLYIATRGKNVINAVTSTKLWESPGELCHGYDVLARHKREAYNSSELLLNFKFVRLLWSLLVWNKRRHVDTGRRAGCSEQQAVFRYFSYLKPGYLSIQRIEWKRNRRCQFPNSVHSNYGSILLSFRDITIGYRTEDGSTSSTIVIMGPSCLVFEIRRWEEQPDDGPKTENIALSVPCRVSYNGDQRL